MTFIVKVVAFLRLFHRYASQFLDILTLTYGPGLYGIPLGPYGPGPFII